MAQGPGKYDDLCTKVREEAQAVGAVVIVLNGNCGSGFSVQGPPELSIMLPELLESLASEIRSGADEVL